MNIQVHFSFNSDCMSVAEMSTSCEDFVCMLMCLCMYVCLCVNEYLCICAHGSQRLMPGVCHNYRFFPWTQTSLNIWSLNSTSSHIHKHQTVPWVMTTVRNAWPHMTSLLMMRFKFSSSSSHNQLSLLNHLPSPREDC